MVIQRNGIDIECAFSLHGPHLVDHLQCPINDGQGTQAKKVELDQPRLFDIVLVELHHQPRAILIGQQRGKVSELGWCNHHSTSVPAGATGHSFELDRHFPYLGGLFVGFQKLPECRLGFQCLGQGHAHLERDQLGKLVA